MARKPTSKRPPRKADIKAAADRAEKTAKGEPIEAPKVDIDPAIIMAEEIKAARGRPTLYKPEFAARAAVLCEAGAIDPELAEEFDVSLKTINRWKVTHAEFRQAIKDNKPIANDRVKRSLYHRATGTEYEEVVPIKLKRVVYSDGKRVSEEERVELVTVKKTVPADTTAAIFWMKNRERKDWMDVQRHEHGEAGDFDQMSDEELDQFISAKEEVIQAKPSKSKQKPSTRH